MTDLAPARLWTDRLEHWAVVQPDAHCVTYQDQSYTWREWHERVHRLAGALAAAGVRRGDRIATLDMNNLATVELTNAAALVGAAHVIVNFRLFGDQLAYVLSDSTPKVLVVGADFVPNLDAVRSQLTGLDRVVVVGGVDDEYQEWLASSAPIDADPDVDPEDTVLVMYSSGTTGFPKGVELSHRAMNATASTTTCTSGSSPG